MSYIFYFVDTFSAYRVPKSIPARAVRPAPCRSPRIIKPRPAGAADFGAPYLAVAPRLRSHTHVICVCAVSSRAPSYRYNIISVAGADTDSRIYTSCHARGRGRYREDEATASSAGGRRRGSRRVRRSASGGSCGLARDIRQAAAEGRLQVVAHVADLRGVLDFRFLDSTIARLEDCRGDILGAGGEVDGQRHCGWAAGHPQQPCG